MEDTLEKVLGRRATLSSARVVGNVPYKVNSLHRLLDRQIKRFLSETHAMTTAEFYVMAHLDKHGPQQVRDISDQSFLFKSQVSYAITALKRKKFVSKHRDQTDRRSPLFELSPAGLATYRKIQTWTDERQRRLAAQLTIDQRTVLNASLDILIDYMKDEQ